MKKLTFAQARLLVFDRLKNEGWMLRTDLKVPHATSPDNRTRLWFKAQAVYMNDGGTDPRKFENTHSLVSDLREYADPDVFMKIVTDMMDGAIIQSVMEA